MVKAKLSTVLFCVLIMLTLIACNQPRNQGLTRQVEELDSMVYNYPKFVFNSLEQLKSNGVSRYNRAYIDLVQTIAVYNIGREIQSDSMITRAVGEFARHPENHPENYRRSLIYQGIIRFRNGITDSRAYLPLKDALKMDETENKLDLRTRFFANYYLGIIHNKNNNVNQAHDYFRQALLLAETLNDRDMLFITYRDMYLNRMKALDFLTAKTLLETLQSYPCDSEEKIRDVKNAEAMFYNSQKRYRNALKLDYELLAADKKKNDRVALLADYYRISDNYKYMNKPDSALFYGNLAAENIVDTTFYLNYYYYLNVAEIAAGMNNWQKSTVAYQQVYRLMNRAINNQLNTQILELERKYDVASAENRAMNLKTNNMWLQFILVVLALVLIIWGLISNHRARLRKEQEKFMIQEKKILEQEKQLAEEKEKQMYLDKQLAERKLVEKQFVIPIYRQISQRNLNIKNFLLDLQGNSYIGKNPQILQKIETEYHDFIQTIKINDTQFLSDALFADLTGINTDESRLFNESEKMMMAFIATGSDNQQMATLLNTSVESIRVRKSKLKKKMQENQVKIPENLQNEV